MREDARITEHDRLFSEKHEMIMREDARITEHDRLFSEKHEMIMREDARIAEHDRLFSEKHDMILVDRKEIANLCRLAILSYWKDKKLDDEQEQIIDYLTDHELKMYSYQWTEEYQQKQVEVLSEDGFLYVLHRNNKLFFPRNYTRESVVQYYRFLIMEQDYRSPHLYFSESFSPANSNIDLWIDCGAAEGIVTLEHLSQFNEAILIENDPGWIEALHKTFNQCNNVRIIPRFLCDRDDDNNVSLSTLIKKPRKCLVKMDIEGNEMAALNGLDVTLLKEGSMLAICAYHHQDDLDTISAFLNSHEIEFEISNGYLLSDWGGYREPFFRRGMIRATIRK